MTEAQDAFNARLAHARERKQKTSKRLQLAKRDAKDKIRREGRCRNPRCTTGDKPHWHHLVPRSKFGQREIAQHHPDNACPLCHRCHMEWHQNRTVLYRIDLSVSEVEFIVQHAGESWLERHYPEQ